MKTFTYNIKPRTREETPEQYYRRIKAYLPNIPHEVVSQWLYDHYSCVKQRYSWLDLGSIRFTSERWKTEDILSKVTAWNEIAVENWKKALLTNQGFQSSRLGCYMISKGTWPVPPIIFNNTTDIRMPDGSEIAKWELIEGHHRLAYLRAIEIVDDWEVCAEHPLWILTIK